MKSISVEKQNANLNLKLEYWFYLSVDELGEEALGLSSGDIATVIAPNQDAAFYV